MSDTVIVIIAIFLAAILMFIFPLMFLSERNDDIAQSYVQTATIDFVDQVIKTGRLTEKDYSRFVSTISATGNSYDIEMQVQHIDENPGVKRSQTEITKIGENLFYNEYTTQLEEKLASVGEIVLKEGDIFSTRIKNTNITLAESWKSVIYRITLNDAYQISAQHSGTVTVNGSSIPN